MLQLRSFLNVADNTGAKKIMMIGYPKKGNKLYAYLGDVITAVVKEALPYSQVKKNEIVYAIVVRTKKEFKRKDGSYIRFDDNAGVILQAKDSKDPKGTRVFGPIAKEIKDRSFAKIASLAIEAF